MKIAISGFAGSGKTSLAKALFSSLSFKYGGMKLITPSFKDLAKEKGLSLMEVQELAEKDENIDKELDSFIKKSSKKAENCIVASWLSIWMVEADLKVFLHSSLEERARRVAKRDGMSYVNALQHVKIRDLHNRERYKKLYGIDILSFNDQADLVLNSTKFSIEQEVKIIEHITTLINNE